MQLVDTKTGEVITELPSQVEMEEDERHRVAHAQERVRQALEPLNRNAVTDYERIAAKRATEVALASVESRSVEQVLKTAFEMYQADVDRAVRLRTGK